MAFGASLFNPSFLSNLQVKEQDDEEDTEDKRRRDEELKQDLKTAFSDFEDDDDEDDDECEDCSRDEEESIPRKLPNNKSYRNSTGGQMHQNHIADSIQNSPSNRHRVYCYELSKDKSNPQKESIDVPIADQKLQMMYELRVREVQMLGEKLEACQSEAAVEHDALYGRLAIANAETERAQVSLQQSQELLANSKHHIAKLEQKISSLSSKVEVLQIKNEELTADLSATSLSLMDAKNRLETAKMSNDTAQMTDNLFRSQQERHKEETDRLERELMRTRNKLSDKENELMILEKRFIDMERLKEDLLVEKVATVNKLAMELEEAQNRLVDNSTIKQNGKIAQLVSERNTAKLQVKELGLKLESTATELVETRKSLSKLKKDMHGLESTIEQLVENRESASFSELHGSPSISSYDDKINLLRSELTKNITTQKIKREQIDKLEKTIAKKDEEHKIAEEKYRKKIDLLETENNKLRETCEELNIGSSKLINDLKESKNLITQLNTEIELQGQREILLNDLTKKAKHFEKFILDNQNRVENMKDAATSPKLSNERKFSNDDSNNKIDISKVEDKIREDITQHFVEKLKNIEGQYVKNKVELEKYIAEITQLLGIKTREVETLQKKILSERQNYIANNKNASDDESNHIDCMKHLNIYKEIVDNLSLEVKTLKLETVPKSQFDKLNDEFSLNLQELEKIKERYKRLKKTAVKFKDYIKEKDVHVRNELDRIKKAYEVSLLKVQERLKILIPNEKQDNLKSSKEETSPS